MLEYLILNILQQIIMTANTYKTQTSTSDKAMTKLHIIGFCGQLKGWCDYHLTETEHLQILTSIHMTEEQTLILD
jgi:CheY-specific phosphatase CheX